MALSTPFNGWAVLYAAMPIDAEQQWRGLPKERFKILKQNR
jgi:hypothetical protein